MNSDCGCYVQGTSCEVAAWSAVGGVVLLLLLFAVAYWKAGRS